MTRILLLGGTTEASRMAGLLAEAGIAGVFSYAGRTAAPVRQPLPLRIGGFGGAEGMAAFLRAEGITGVIDATHPFAAQISRNAVAASAAANVPLIALERPPWPVEPGWTCVADIAGAIAALPDRARVFLGIGKQNLDAFAGRPHDFLLRLVDAPAQPPIPGATVVVARGPFTEDGDLALLRDWGAEIVVAKNAGGTGAAAKLAAARRLGLRVIMIDRPAMPPRPVTADPAEVLRWAHSAPLGV